MKSQRGMISYVVDMLRTHTPGDKAIIKFRRRKEGGEERCPGPRDKRKLLDAGIEQYMESMGRKDPKQSPFVEYETLFIVSVMRGMYVDRTSVV